MPLAATPKPPSTAVFICLQFVIHHGLAAMRRGTYFPCFAKESKQRKASRTKSAPRCPCFVVSQTIKPFVSLLAAVFATREPQPQLHQRSKYQRQYCAEGIVGIWFGGYTPVLVSTSRPWSRAVREALGKVLSRNLFELRDASAQRVLRRLA
ncbi:hypothetical protein, partial [Chitinibacter sp. ZOR0017]|uniref:hypothetical protein n=1 Tax=Chitinibacter sp. ZOR0017 TaxID=1339254 RepID=UPI001E3BD931